MKDDVIRGGRFAGGRIAARSDPPRLGRHAVKHATYTPWIYPPAPFAEPLPAESGQYSNDAEPRRDR
ncbi:hypothetical protein ACNUDN_27795 [Mycobacterium sp. smrl_JER01]|uniref:hypothetical protein n=1 Tax=Mycobacterium sp. smrl_JER01 TaxID=3402633 RepID=UPI003AC692BF